MSSPCRPRTDTQEAQSCTVRMYPPGPQTPSPACCLGLAAVLAHGEWTWRPPRGAGLWQHSGPFSGGGPGKTTTKEAPGPPPSHAGAPEPSPPGGQSFTQVFLGSPTPWPLPVLTPQPQLWCLGHPRQPWWHSPQQTPRSPRPPWALHSGGSTACTCLPVTPSLSARGSGPRSGRGSGRHSPSSFPGCGPRARPQSQRWSPWGSGLTHPGARQPLLCAATPPPPPPPDRKALKPQASSGDSC